MKSFAFALIALSAVAAQAAPAKLVAKSVTSGGFHRPEPGVCTSSEISIYSNGKAVQTKCGKSASTLLTLSPVAAKSLVQIAAMSGGGGGTLEPVDPTAAECQDAPSTIYTLMTPKGPVEVGGRINCREVHLSFIDRMRHFESDAARVIDGVQSIASGTLQ